MTTPTKRLHGALLYHYPKTGRCEECASTGKTTVWAYQHHPRPHTLHRQDYREQCRSCHAKLDGLIRRLQARFGTEALAA